MTNTSGSTGTYTVAVVTAGLAPNPRVQMALGTQLSTRLADALERAWRTFKVGIGTDLAVALTMVLAPLFLDVHWTKTWWVALGLLAGKTILSTIGSYALRRWGRAPKIGLKV